VPPVIVGPLVVHFTCTPSVPEVKEASSTARSRPRVGLPTLVPNYVAEDVELVLVRWL
jgi:hypothetical protein